ncbi:GntR family transcriptional regulator [Mycobacterium sp. ACS4331]|uniref:GntR family transcriptional regulator n=1 Tax=Mycobacterium sp. ACS4331 TaxID=1834121 RepID=UPI0007FDA843|nr:GntR family transcriptional regulator [Mycobacterium sp. ACS4331]OBF29735.1 hypothetical protein A5727_23815 [Mycobacterium sp. ACS4331]
MAPSNPKQPTAKQTLAEKVFDAVRDEVLSGRIPPGTKLKLVDYSQRFDVSLSVIREAMGRLAEQGLLQANPQRGFSTLSLSTDDLTDLTRARVIIESATLRESISNGDLAWEAAVVAAHHRLASTPVNDADGLITREFASVHREFHVALLAGSGNVHLESVATSLRDRSELYLHWSRHLGADAGRDIAAEHRELMELALARDAEAGAKSLECHIQRTTDSLIEYRRNATGSGDVESASER